MRSQVRGSSRMMVQAFLVGVAALLSFSLGSPAFAASTYDYVDADWISQTASDGSSVSGTFDITENEGDCVLGLCDTGVFEPDGDPSTQDIDSAAITFLLLDVQYGGHDVANIELGGSSDPFQMATVDGSDRFLFVFYLEHIDVELELLLQLSDEGKVEWEIEPAEGNPSVFVWAGALQASAAVANTPEPTAALLFCVGFGVVGAATRKRRTH